MRNAAASRSWHEIDSADLLVAYRSMEADDQEPMVLYHSHTAAAAYPSEPDIAFASEPGAHHVIVSTQIAGTVEVRSFRIIDGVVNEEPVNITDDQATDLR